MDLRPARVPLASASSAAFCFQVLEVSVQNAACPTFNITDQRFLKNDVAYQEHSDAPRALTYNKAGPCIVYLFGSTQQGHSVCARVSGFKPWFYVELTPTVTLAVVKQLAQEIQRSKQIDVEVQHVQKKRVYGWVPASPRDVHTVKQFDFAQLFFPTVAAMNAVFYLLQDHNKGADCKLAALRQLRNVQLDVSEGKVQPSEKFLATCDLTASAWVRVSTAALTVVDDADRCSVAQYEVECDMHALKPAPDIRSVAPIVIAAVDIEVQSSDFCSFPDAHNEGDACTYIGTTFWVYGDREPRRRVMQVLGACDPVQGMDVRHYETELELLNAWRDLIALEADPDKVISYNGTGFDFAYMNTRFEKLRKRVKRYSRFLHLGRLLFQAQPLQTRELVSAAMGQNEVAVFPMAGRWQMDLFTYIKTNYKLSSYKLDDVCKHFLASARLEQCTKVVLDHPGWVKELVHAAAAAIQPFLPTGGEWAQAVAQMVQLAEAPLSLRNTNGSDGKDEIDMVLQDEEEQLADDASSRWLHVHAALVDLMSKLFAHLRGGGATGLEALQAVVDTRVQPALDACGSDNYKKLFRMYTHSSAARATIASYCQVDCDLVLYLLDRISVVPNTVQMSQVTNTLLSDIANRGQQIKTFNLIARAAFMGGYVLNYRDVGWDPAAEYEGATVLPPRPGYYQTPVATLDFASLYPSIMQGYNLCFSSLVLDAQYQHLEASGATYGRYTIAGKTWVFQQHHQGLLPQILANLVAARRACKKDMAKCEKGSLDYKLADGKQLALKVSCNSVYGFTGALATGMFPCMPVAVATTFNGRNLIQQTREFVERGYGATVIYGDTDSVMLQFPGVDTIHAAFDIAERVARECSATFPDVVNLEFEKVYCPYLLIKKKHYAGIKYEGDPDEPPTLDAKGLALVRRDNCKLVRDTMREVLLHAMRNNNPMAAYEAVQRQVQRLVNREVPLEELEISNFLRKDLKSDHHPHLQVVKNMTARGSFGVPRVGDRVPYCILEGSSSNIYERAEHPKYIQEAGLKVDLEYYLRRQLQQRLEKVLKPLPVPDADRLFDLASLEIQRKRNKIARLDSFGFMFSPAAPRVPVPVETPTPVAVAVAATPTLQRNNQAAHASLAKLFPGASVVTSKSRAGVKRKKEDSSKQQTLLACFSSVPGFKDQ